MGPDGSGPRWLGPLDPFCHLLLVPMEIVGLLAVLLSPSWGGGLLIGGAAAVAVAAVALLDKWTNRPREAGRLPEDDIPTTPHPAVQQSPRARPQQRDAWPGPARQEPTRQGPSPQGPSPQGPAPQGPAPQGSAQQAFPQQAPPQQGSSRRGSSWRGDLSPNRDPGPSWPDGPSHTR